MTLDYEFMGQDIPVLLRALPATITLTLWSMLVALLFAVTCGAFILVRIPVLKQLVIVINTFIKGVPLVIQLLFCYYAVPIVAKGLDGFLGYHFDPRNPPYFPARDWLARYFAGEKPMPSELPLCPIGGEFRQRVWRLLCQIPYGETTTYGALARALAAQMGKPSMSSQAVGGAVGHNPISIIIPCHRVVGSGGSLTGYAGGIAAKLRLLEHEGVELSRLSVPKRGTAL